MVSYIDDMVYDTREKNFAIFKECLKQIAFLDRCEVKHPEISGFRRWKAILDDMSRIYKAER
jgi:hypothetical protein